MCYYRGTLGIATLAPMLRDINPFGLRMPPDLKDLIKDSAAKKEISINSEIVDRLKSTFSPYIDLSGVSTGELARELIDRNEPGRVKISIEINRPEDAGPGEPAGQ